MAVQKPEPATVLAAVLRRFIYYYDIGTLKVPEVYDDSEVSDTIKSDVEDARRLVKAVEVTESVVAIAAQHGISSEDLANPHEYADWDF